MLKKRKKKKENSQTVFEASENASFETKGFFVSESEDGSLRIDDKHNYTKGVVVSKNRSEDIVVTAKKLNQFRLTGTDEVVIAF